MVNLMIALGALNAFLAVAAGAFAAHLLKNTLTLEYLNTFRTAADYQFFHGLGLIVIGLLTQLKPNKMNSIAAILMFAGIVLFSGSLYLLVITGSKWLGMITPLGGICFLLAWLILAVSYLLKKD